jgi:hypothetical protein
VAALTAGWAPWTFGREQREVASGKRGRRAGAREARSSCSPCASGGKIHIELPGRVSIRLEGDVDAATVRLILKSLRP